MPIGANSGGDVVLASPAASLKSNATGVAISDSPQTHFGSKTLTVFDTVALGLSIGVAAALAAVRLYRKKPFELHQMLNDALNVGTIAVLFVMVVASLPFHIHWIDQASEAAAGTTLIDTAFVYCIVVIIASMRKGL